VSKIVYTKKGFDTINILPKDKNAGSVVTGIEFVVNGKVWWVWKKRIDKIICELKKQGLDDEEVLSACVSAGFCVEYFGSYNCFCNEVRKND
jgi:hypothetical protein